ncbi:MAG: hypothetical protein AAGJ94_11875 [Pseudomonadota bacterium]
MRSNLALAVRTLALSVVLAAGAAQSAPSPGADRSAHDAGAVDGGALQMAILGRLRGDRGAGNCLDLSEVGDRDVQRNAGAIRAAGLCVTADGFSEQGYDWRFTIISNPKARRGPVWYLPHDDESEAFDAAVYAVARYGGRLVAVDGNEGRNYRGIDPNRHFAVSAQDARPCAMRGPAPQYTRYVMGLFRGARHIFSMHNNTRGGGVTVNVNTNKVRGFQASGRFSDPDHLVYIASRRPLSQDRDARALRDKLLGAGLSVVHETVTRQNSDCSFSNHVALHDRRDYFNIEAVHGSTLQKAMVDTLLATLGYRPVR